MMYKSIKHLSEITDICAPEVRRKISMMKQSGIYPMTAFLTNPIRVDYDAFIHFNTYQKLMEDGKPFPAWKTT